MTPNSLQLRGVIYTRVSSDPLNRGRSVTEQEAECRIVAQSMGWEVVRVFTDSDRSASRYATRTRPAFAELVEFLRGGNADVLICWEFSRATRDLRAYVELRELCIEQQVLLSYGGSTYDMTTARDRRASAQDAVDAENESGKTSERVQRSMRAAAAKGRPHGRRLFGYKRVYDAASGELVRVELDEHQAAVLREAANRILEGESSRAIARDFQRRGLPAPHGNHWHPTNLPRLLRNPAYVARRVHRGNVVGAAAWPALFDESKWTYLQAKLADPGRRSRQGDSTARHLLTGIATCAVCGGRISSMKTPRAANASDRSLICIGVLGAVDNHRFCVSRREADVDAWVESVVVERLSRPDALAAFRPDHHTEKEVSIAKEEVRILQERLQEATELASRGGLSIATLGALETTLMEEIARLQSAAARAATPALLHGIDLEDLSTRWDDGTYFPIVLKRAILRTFFEVKIHPTGRGRRSFDPDSVSVRFREQPKAVHG